MSTLGGILSGCQDRTNEPQQKGVVKTNAQEIDLPLYYPGTSDNTEVKEAIVLRYYGHCRTENGQRIYDISMIYHRPITPEDYEQQYKIVINFYDLVSHENLQTISYIPPLGMDPGSIKCGLSIVDVNADGYDDFMRIYNEETCRKHYCDSRGISSRCQSMSRQGAVLNDSKPPQISVRT